MSMQENIKMYLPESSSSEIDDVPTISPINEENTTNVVWEYGGGFFQKFASAYEPIHLPLSVIICLFGVVANTLNVIVLTRRSMASPINILLTGLSAAQLFLLMNYLLLLTFNVCASSCLIPALHSYSATTYKWINVNLSVAFHTTALMHTLVLAIFRFMAVQMPAFARNQLTIPKARACVITLHAVVPFLCTPTFFTSHVAKVHLTDERSARSICYLDDAYDLDYVSYPELLEAAMWTFGIFFKLVPSLTISALSIYLIFSLRRYQEKKARLTGMRKQFERHEYRPLLMPVLGVLYDSRANDPMPPLLSNTTDGAGRDSATPDSAERESPAPINARLLVNTLSANNNTSSSIKKKKDTPNPNPNSRQRRSVTKMLVAVALFCASVELPHGVINLLTAVFGQRFGMEVYDNLGDFFEMLTLLYSSVSFVLYCIMSTEFQRTFGQLFCDPVRKAVVRKISRKRSEFQTISGFDENSLDTAASCDKARKNGKQSISSYQRK